MHPGTFEVYRVLADGAPRDAATLRNTTRLAPAELDAACADLATLGAPVEAQDGRYRLREAIELLDTVRIAILLEGSRARIDVIPVCESTNALALERARTSVANGTAITCEIQTAGRGRRGNRWAAPPGGSVALSMVWHFPAASMPLAGLSLVAGLGCLDALDGLGVPGVGLKWPNDLVAQGGKLGGVLVEVAGSAAVVGVGINVHLSQSLAGELGQPVVDIASLGPAPSRNVLVASLADSLATALAGFEARGFAAYRDAWAARHALQGERVRVLPAGGVPIEGRAVGVAEDGALLVETVRGVERFVSAEVSLRAAA